MEETKLLANALCTIFEKFVGHRKSTGIGSITFVVMSAKFRQLTIVILAVAVLLQGMATLAVLGGLELNRDYIAKELCVKKKEVKNCCKGSCFIKKELADTDENSGDSKQGKSQKTTHQVEWMSSWCSISFLEKYATNGKVLPNHVAKPGHNSTLAGVATRLESPPEHWLTARV